jgi:predicted O-methyltransferase YrrM
LSIDTASTIARRLLGLEWRPDSVLLDDLVLELEHYRAPTSVDRKDRLRFYKIKPLIDQYVRLWSMHPTFDPQYVFELGIWHGGGTAFWFEMLQPQKMIAVDVADRSDPPAFENYVAARRLLDRLRTFWRVDQADRKTLRRLVDSELHGRLDLVLDDASHVYEPTKASFEALFPLLSPGGLYIIEDWAWGHWNEYNGAGSASAAFREPTPLICDLVLAAGTSPELIADITVMQGFACVQRGPAVIPDMQRFSLDRWIVRRPMNRKLFMTRLRTIAHRFRRS